jgi:BASS family bile acid:Na+ symporter
MILLQYCGAKIGFSSYLCRKLMPMLLRFLKNWTLPVAMSIGALGYPIIIHIRFMMPYFLFCVLLFTFIKVSFKDLRYEPLHGWLLAIQMVGSFAFFFILYPFNKYVAEGAMLCMVAPTAAAAAAVTGKLGGSISSTTTYTILSSILTAIIVPLAFPYVASLPPDIDVHADNNFFVFMFIIMKRIFPILILPMILAYIIRRYIPPLYNQMIRIKDANFYLWGMSLIIITAVTVESLVDSKVDGWTEILITLSGLVTCIIQFFIGKRIGSHYNQRVTGGQGLGQKNTVITIWISQMYMNPIASIAPCSYVIWQNIINSYQLWKKRKKDNELSQTKD